jgi:hypothetical protein
VLLLTLKGYKNEKASGSDEINIELITKASLSYLLKFFEFLNTCWKTGYNPDEWKPAVISPIFNRML